MKAAVFIGVAVVVGALAYYLLTGEDQSHKSHASHKSHQSDPPTSKLTDHSEVFKKAFWKRPSADDKILHAERREWADANGVEKWQWFIAVEPSPALVKHLREDNAFSLTPAASIPAIKDAPAWFAFQPADAEILQAPHGQMRLIFSKTKRLLLATDSGGGFHPGAPEPAEAMSPPSAPIGRLPGTPPPNPPAR